MNVITQNFHSLKSWATDDQHRASRQLVGKAFAQVAVSYLIQKIAIKLFAIKGGLVILCSITALGFGVSLLSARCPIVAKVCRFVAQFGVIKLIHEMCLTVFIHEMGHALMGAALYRHPLTPKVEVDLFGGGRTQTVISTLSPLGKAIGHDRVKLLVAAGGPIASVVFAMGMFGWASYQTDDAAKERLAIHGGVQLVSEMSYAWEAIGSRASVSNDYVALQQWGGINPKVALGAMILLPAIQLIWLNRRRPKACVNNAG